MDAAAHWVALITVVAVPPVALFWFIVHPFTHWWRALGPVKAYLILFGVIGLLMLLIFRFREPLLHVRFGVSGPLTALAIVLFVTSMAIGVLRIRHLTPAVLFGLPQLSNRSYPGRLITDGIYAHIRHPRYVQVGLGLIAVALFANYLATYVIAAAYVPVIYGVVLLEERELRDRFDKEYDQYANRVPRFLPRLKRSWRPSARPPLDNP